VAEEIVREMKCEGRWVCASVNGEEEKWPINVDETIPRGLFCFISLLLL
jgi:hypothetical protein